LHSEDENKKVNGEFLLQRTTDRKTWDTLAKFKLTYLSDLNNFTWKDWSVEQGVKYIYAI
jgi:hypothetical protein